MIGLGFDQNTKNWISDRIENEEPLYWNEFIRFMRDSGVSEQKLNVYKYKKYREKVKRVYQYNKQLYKSV